MIIHVKDNIHYYDSIILSAEPNTPDKKEAPDALYDVPNPAAPPAPPPPPLPGQNGSSGHYASSRENSSSNNKASTLPSESGRSSRASSFST